METEFKKGDVVAFVDESILNSDGTYFGYNIGDIIVVDFIYKGGEQVIVDKSREEFVKIWFLPFSLKLLEEGDQIIFDNCDDMYDDGNEYYGCILGEKYIIEYIDKDGDIWVKCDNGRTALLPEWCKYVIPNTSPQKEVQPDSIQQTDRDKMEQHSAAIGAINLYETHKYKLEQFEQFLNKKNCFNKIVIDSVEGKFSNDIPEFIKSELEEFLVKDYELVMQHIKMKMEKELVDYAELAKTYYQIMMEKAGIQYD